MSGLMVRLGAVFVAVAAMSARLEAGATPVVPVEDRASSVDLAAVSPLSAPADVDGLATPIANQTSTTAIPLPPGVVFGLVGLASAAIARRRYMKR